MYSQKFCAVNKYKFIVGPGNNSQVVKQCLMLREERWEEANSFDKLFSFKWQPWSRNIGFQQLNSFGMRQLVNHLPGHEQVTTKDMLFENMSVLCECKKLNTFDYLPLTFTLQFKDGDGGLLEF